MRLVEFYPELQGRPESKVALQDGTRRPSIPEWSIRGIMLAGEFSATSKTDNYTAGNEMVILVDTSAMSVKVTLPSAEDSPSKVYWIKNIGTGTVIVEGDTVVETIDGEKTITLSLQYQYIMVICNGTEWFILGGEYVKMEDILIQLVDKQEEANEILQNIETHLRLGSDEELDKEEI